MRHWMFAILILTLAVPVSAQRLNLDFPGLADRASETVDVTLDAQMLRLAAKFFSGQDAEERGLGEMVQKLEGIYVRSFEFDRAGEYDLALVDRVKKQLGPTWKRLVNVKSKRESVEVYTDLRGDAIVGLLVISAEPRELTIVNIVGPIDLEKLGGLEGQFGIPRMTTKGEKKDRRDRE